ncbi:NAD-dependent epimerase/dehydratase family protein [Ktedonospora formicarum]|uniref:NAD-dependent epimerase/dehydratase domain-containing protein n=1 Tax=Ktedonospora formicarum TaxID=2778364 RepID=A0A8J3MVM1_9CHLR|nr:NAD-dependent epimerase/dehydratase family protein [Ktedonospora formicarum]GHO49480.1 hypothetical protein KSX_76430 [Ktedonospora formicarum]
MKLLILGGTGFLGRHLVETALERGHTITLFNRGQTDPELFPQVEQIHGNRANGLRELNGRAWDAVIDSNGQVPRHVSESAHLLAEYCEHYTFISTTSVYADYTVAHIDESSPVIPFDDLDADASNMATYGGRKALAERLAAEAMPGRVLVIRPGLIVGPYDPTDRFTYWPHRVTKGGQILAPDNPERPVQFIDARDLAAWTLAMVESRQVGTYNAKGPTDTLSIGQLLEACREVSGNVASFTWVDEAFLQGHDVAPYRQMPLWVPSEMVGFSRVDCRKAIAAGLRFRPLKETIQDTLTWDMRRPSDYVLRAGLAPDHELELLRQWTLARDEH